ncbi:hypothetical protein V4U86_25665 [Mycobacterium sp. AMU20-3851]
MAIESMAGLGLTVHSLIRFARVHDHGWTPEPVRPSPRNKL